MKYRNYLNFTLLLAVITAGFLLFDGKSTVKAEGESCVNRPKTSFFQLLGIFSAKAEGETCTDRTFTTLGDWEPCYSNDGPIYSNVDIRLEGDRIIVTWDPDWADGGWGDPRQFESWGWGIEWWVETAPSMIDSGVFDPMFGFMNYDFSVEAINNSAEIDLPSNTTSGSKFNYRIVPVANNARLDAYASDNYTFTAP